MNDRLVVLAQMSGFDKPEEFPELERLMELLVADMANMMHHVANSSAQYTTTTALVRLEQMLKESYGLK